jgi:hypothetical protein
VLGDEIDAASGDRLDLGGVELLDVIVPDPRLVSAARRTVRNPIICVKRACERVSE